MDYSQLWTLYPRSLVHVSSAFFGKAVRRSLQVHHGLIRDRQNQPWPPAMQQPNDMPTWQMTRCAMPII